MEMKTIKTKREKKIQKQQFHKNELLTQVNKLRREFLEIERKIARNFNSFSLNEIWEYKETMQSMEIKIRRFASKLKNHHKVDINLEDRESINESSN